jgi:hypothetical protein
MASPLVLLMLLFMLALLLLLLVLQRMPLRQASGKD